MIVTRGLGSPSSTVTVGLALSLALIIPPPITPTPPSSGVGSIGLSGKAVVKVLRESAHVQLTQVQATALISALSAHGGAKVPIYELDTGVVVSPMKATASGKALALLMPSSINLAPFTAKGKIDLSDEEIVALVLAALDL